MLKMISAWTTAVIQTHDYMLYTNAYNYRQ